ncbi:MAG: TetR/AcrR family transcriptional regulator [candidate division Zixibacteria bacterium]|nr:TetR/AcrR family transcriptional regulator [candidate division Zixibacteria bacterium]
MSPKIIDKDKKREEIFRSAMKVFAQKGIHDFKMIDIAETAGVGKGTLYEYFSSKEQLVEGCFGILLEDFDAHMKSRLSDIVDPAEKMKQYISTSFDFFRLEKDRLDILFDLYASGIPHSGGRPLFEGLTESYRRVKEYLASIVKEGVRQGVFRPVDANLVSAMLAALLDGILFHAAMGVTSIESEALPKKLTDIFLGGIVK